MKALHINRKRKPCVPGCGLSIFLSLTQTHTHTAPSLSASPPHKNHSVPFNHSFFLPPLHGSPKGFNHGENEKCQRWSLSPLRRWQGLPEYDPNPVSSILLARWHHHFSRIFSELSGPGEIPLIVHCPDTHQSPPGNHMQELKEGKHK